MLADWTGFSWRGGPNSRETVAPDLIRGLAYFSPASRKKAKPCVKHGATTFGNHSFTYFWKLFRSFISLGGITARQ
jgi:hypothetical protein